MTTTEGTRERTDEQVEAAARALCHEWGYLWDYDADDLSDAQHAPEHDEPGDDRPSKDLFRRGARAVFASLAEGSSVG